MAARQHWRETGLWAGLFVWAEHRTQGLLCFVAGDPVDPLQSVPLLGVDRRVEVKCRGVGFRRLCDWLESNDFLIVRADRREPLVVISPQSPKAARPTAGTRCTVAARKAAKILHA